MKKHSTFFSVAMRWCVAPLQQGLRCWRAPGRALTLRRRAMAVACAFGVLVLSTSARGADLWDDNDYILGTLTDMVILDENFNVKQSFRHGPISGSWFGSADWFTNGDVILSVSRLLDDFLAVRYTRQGAQLAFIPPSGGLFSPTDTKVSFNDDIIVGFFTYGVGRYTFGDPQQRQTIGFAASGGVAVVPRADGTHELWVAADEDLGGLRIYPIDAPARCRLPRQVFPTRSCPPTRPP